MGNFNTLKTAQNTWSKIKGKLPVLEGEGEGDGADGGGMCFKLPPCLCDL
jgi:hypothetical protein